MKMRIPRTKVAKEAPTLVLMFLAAQRPNAAEPPAAFTRATMMPSSTRNRKMPALSEMAATRPSLTIMSSAPMGEKFCANSAPTVMPINREL